MATALIRRLLSRNILKFKDIPNYPSICTCTNIFISRINDRNVSSRNILANSNMGFGYKPEMKYITFREYSNKTEDSEKKEEKKLTLFQRFKLMYKEFWYVLVPVHVVTSIAWFGGFYYMAKSGVDVISILESLHVSHKIINPLKESSVGYIAVAYALYKITTPVRYTVTLGGTTISINYLKKWGYIKPVPSTQRLKEMYQEKKDNILETVRETKEGLKIQSEKLKDAMENLEDSIKQVKTKKDQVEKVKKELKKD